MLSTLVLVINCGSSSLKFALVDAVSGRASLTGLAECLHQPEARIEWTIANKKQHVALGANAAHREALHFIVDHINAPKNGSPTNLIAIGHRIVHGGDQFTQPVIIDTTVLEGIKKYQHFAPLHNPAAVIGIEAAWQAFPQLVDKNVAVFDTAFHQTLPEQAYLYALPYSLYQQHAIRRYGFHGTSHQFVSQQAAVLLGKAVASFNGITCHLGNGASVTAIRNGVSIDTSMGLTPLEGLVMGTRCGDIDPAIIFYLYRVIGLSMEQIESLLTKGSGLLGLTGNSSDCRYLEQHYQSDPHAQRALTLFCYRLVKYIGAYAAVLGDPLDALVFTGGIGENSALVREQVVNQLSILGFKLHSANNLATRFGKSGFISQPSNRAILVIPTNEEHMIAQAVFALLQGSDNPACGSAARH